MEPDENAPPKSGQPTQAGLLSPFGFLAGVRAMLSPSVKDQQSQESDSPVTSRPVLKDMNTSGSQKVRILNNAGQGAAAGQGDKVDVVPPAGDVLAHLSPGWSEKGERTSSVASDYSFVSALSPDVNAFQDGLQLSPSKLNGVESDTDTSTAYESAGETEGNLSSIDDVASRDILLNHPIAVSSPFAVEHEIKVADQSEEFNHQSYGEIDEGNLSVSCLVDPFGSLSLSTPLKQKDTPAKAHVTLDSDVSGDITDSPGPDQDSNANAEVKASLDTTITLSDVSDFDQAPERRQSGITHVETVDISSDTSTGASSVVEVEEVQECESFAHEESSKALAELFDVSNVSADFSVTEEKLLQSFDKPYDYPEEEANSSNAQADEENAALNETVVEIVQESTPELNEIPHFDSPHEAADAKSSDISVCEAQQESPVAPEVTQISDSQKLNDDQVSTTTDIPANNPEELTFEDKAEEAPVSSVVSGCESSFCIPREDPKSELVPSESQVPEKNIESDLCVTDPIVKSETCSSETDRLSDSTREGAQEDTDVPENSKVANSKETLTASVPQSSSFEDEPLPVKVPRSFEEILAEKLAAEGQTVASSEKFEDVPIPVKVPRTFDEILAEQLGLEEQVEKVPGPPQICIKDIPQATETSKELDTVETTNAVGVDTTETPEVFGLIAGVEGTVEEPAEACSSVEVPSVSDTTLQDSPVRKSPSKKSPFKKSPLHTLPEQKSPSKSSREIHEDEIPILPKAPRTFEEILAAELAAQSNPELAVPSFSASGANKLGPGKLNESFADIITSANVQASSLDAESEPDLVPTELEPDTNGGLDSLIETARRQEKDLEQGDSDFNCVAAEASRLSMSCLNETQRSDTNLSQCSDSSGAGNQTVIMVDSCNGNPFVTKSKVGISPPTSRKQIPSGDEVQSDSLAQAVNIEEEEFQSGDAFKDPSAFDFLILHGNNRSARDLRKESLYVKFDPLVGPSSDSLASITMHPENSSDNQTGATGVLEGQQSSENKLNTTENLVSLSPSTSNNQAPDSASVAPVTPVRKNTAKNTPIKTPAHVMLNETLESIGSRGTPVKQEELIKKLQEHQSILEEQDKAYQERIAELEQRLQKMEDDKAEQLNEKDKELQEKVKNLSELQVIMKEYEKTISRLVAEKSQQKASFEDNHVELIKERDQAQQHLNNMEIAFSDIHTKYERVKSVAQALQQNEDTLKASLKQKEEDIVKMQSVYDKLKSHAVTRLEKANEELEAMKQKHQQELAKLKAMIKKLEVKTKSLEEALEQKSKENQALTSICDELINKVGE